MGGRKRLIEEIAGTVPRFVVQISPESHDPHVLQLSNKSFTAASINSSISNILAAGCQRLDIFFMSGMPGQTYASVMESIEYCGKVLKSVDGNPRLRFFISPLAPFLDPGSLAYEFSNRFGYSRFYSTLAEHRNALTAPSWKYVLSYETRWMNRSEIVDSTYQAALRLNRLKETFGQISKEKSQLIEERILKAIDLINHIDRLLVKGSKMKLFQELIRLRSKIEEVNNSTMCEKEELDLPAAGRVPVKIWSTAGMLIGDAVKKFLKNSVT